MKVETKLKLNSLVAVPSVYSMQAEEVIGTACYKKLQSARFYELKRKNVREVGEQNTRFKTGNFHI